MLNKDECRRVLTENLNGFCNAYYAQSGRSPAHANQTKLLARGAVDYATAIGVIDADEHRGIVAWIQQWGTEDLVKYFPLDVLSRLAREADD